MSKRESEQVVEWFRTFDLSKCNLDTLLNYRRRLVTSMINVAKEIAEKSEQQKTIYATRKIEQAKAFLTEEGTVKERESKSLLKIEGMLLDENILDGKITGLKIYHNTLMKVNDSMASYINSMQKI